MAFSENEVLAARVRKKKKKAPTTRETGLQQKESQLARDIETWRSAARLYLPVSVTLQEQHNMRRSPTSKTPRAQELKLWLPSDIPTSHRTAGWSSNNLHGKEAVLRLAQMEDAIVELRDLLRTEQGLLLQFNKDVKNTGQRQVTRALGTLKSMQLRIARVVSRYRESRQALLSLDPGGTWSSTYLKLEDSDVRGQRWEEDERDEERRKQRNTRRNSYLQRQPRNGEGSQGRFESTWIWSVRPHSTNPNQHRGDCPLAKASSLSVGVDEAPSHTKPIASGSAVRLVLLTMYLGNLINLCRRIWNSNWCRLPH